jgi:hypothetical protein
MSIVHHIVIDITLHLKSSSQFAFWLFVKYSALLKEYNQLRSSIQYAANNEKMKHLDNFAFSLCRYLLSFLNHHNNNNNNNKVHDIIEWLSRLNKQEITSFLKEMSNCSLRSDFTKSILPQSETIVFDLMILLFATFRHCLSPNPTEQVENITGINEFFDCAITLIDNQFSNGTVSKEPSQIKECCQEFIRQLIYFWKSFPCFLSHYLRLLDAITLHSYVVCSV